MLLAAIASIVASGLVAQTFAGGAGTIVTTAATQANPYPSDITVSGVGANVADVTVSISGFNHTWTDDLDIVLVGPNGNNIVLMSDCGGTADLVNTNLTFSDAGATQLTTAQVVSGTYLPSNIGTANNTAPCPTPSSLTTFAAAFAGGAADGTWSLYVYDDAAGDGGNWASWSITITPATPTAPVITSTAPANAFVGNLYSYTPTVTGNPTPTLSITSGTLPAWLTLAGGVLSGTPAAGDIGTVGPVTLTATNSAGTGDEVITITVAPAAPEITVLDPNAASVTSGATLTVYAAVAGTSSTGTFTINNTGPNPLNLTGATLVDQGATAVNCTVTITQPTVNPIPATTGTDTFGVDINPTAAGAFSVTLTILNDDADEGTFTVTISGVAKTADDAEIAVWDPNSVNVANAGTFSETNTGTALFNRAFTVRNEGGLTLNLTGTTPIVVSGEANCTVVVTQPGATLAAATTWVAVTDTVSFAITPTAAGAFSFTVTIANNDADEAPFVFTFSGNTAVVSGGGGDDDDGGCSTNNSNGLSIFALLGLLSLLAFSFRFRGSKA
jgi:hypothetical protein